MIRSNCNSKARDISRSYHLKNTSEREIKHIATGTYPQPRGWTIPSSPWRASGWWGWPPEWDSPLRQGAGTGLDWFSMATKASGGGTPDLLCSPKFLGYMDIYRRKKYVGGSPGCPRGRGRAQGGGRAPHPRGQLLYLLTWEPSPSGVFPSKNYLHEFSGQLASVWFSFSAILKNKGKQKLALGSRLIG